MKLEMDNSARCVTEFVAYPPFYSRENRHARNGVIRSRCTVIKIAPSYLQSPRGHRPFSVAAWRSLAPMWSAATISSLARSERALPPKGLLKLMLLHQGVAAQRVHLSCEVGWWHGISPPWGRPRRDIPGYYPSGSHVMKLFRHPRGIIPSLI